MPGFQSVAIIGLGLMGGSLARDLAARGARVAGADADPEALRAARAAGVVARPADAAALAEAELLVLAVPVTAAPEALRRALPHLAPGALVTDLGSTKGSIAAAAEAAGIGARFVGSHPLAGDHRAGWEAGREGLYRDALVYLCPAPSTAPAALARAARLWEELGARPRKMDATEHDRLLAWSSHLPQLTATALAGTLAEAGVPHAALGPGGRDTTRLAASSPEMWAAIALDNAPALAPALDALRERLRQLQDAVAAGDAEALRRLFREGRSWKE